MSTLENYLRTVGAVNERMWAQAEPLEKQLRKLESDYQALRRRPAMDVVARGAASILEPQIDTVAKKLNKIYEEWRLSIVVIGAPPAPTKQSPHWTTQIPWPKFVPPEVRRYITRVIRQEGIPLTDRVTIKPVKFPFGGQGVAIEFGKW